MLNFKKQRHIFLSIVLLISVFNNRGYGATKKIGATKRSQQPVFVESFEKELKLIYETYAYTDTRCQIDLGLLESIEIGGKMNEIAKDKKSIRNIFQAALDRIILQGMDELPNGLNTIQLRERVKVAKTLGKAFNEIVFPMGPEISLWNGLHDALFTEPSRWILDVTELLVSKKEFQNPKRLPWQIWIQDQKQSDQRNIGNGCTPYLTVHSDRMAMAIDMRLGLEEYIKSGKHLTSNNSILGLLEYLQIQSMKLVNTGMKWTYVDGTTISLLELLKNLNTGSTNAYMVYYSDQEDITAYNKEMEAAYGKGKFKSLHFPEDMLSVLYINNHKLTPVETIRKIESIKAEKKMTKNENPELIKVAGLDKSIFMAQFTLEIAKRMKNGESCEAICPSLQSDFQIRFEREYQPFHGINLPFNDFCKLVCNETIDTLKKMDEDKLEDALNDHQECIDNMESMDINQLIADTKKKIESEIVVRETIIQNLVTLQNKLKEEFPSCSVLSQGASVSGCNIQNIKSEISLLKLSMDKIKEQVDVDCADSEGGGVVIGGLKDDFSFGNLKDFDLSNCERKISAQCENEADQKLQRDEEQ